MESSNEGALYMTDIDGSIMSIADILFGLMLVWIDCGTGAEICGGMNILLTREQYLLGVFGQCPCRFKIIGLVSTSVEVVDAPDQIPG